MAMVMHRVMRILAHDAQRAAAHRVIVRLMLVRGDVVPSWWRWTCGLAAGIAMRRIDLVPAP